jgi:hypothetical protein
MSIFRVQKSKNYSVISNTFIFDDKLSWKAKGIMTYFLARPDDWEFYMIEVAKNATDGKDSLRKGIKELEEAGYIERTGKRTGGQFKGYEYNVYETPCRDNRSGKTAAVKPISENPPLQSTDFNVNTELSNIGETFESLWKLYPQKRDKHKVSKKAKEAMHKVGYEKMKLAIERYVAECKTCNRYYKNGSTFFNGAYEDYLADDFEEIKKEGDMDILDFVKSAVN